MKIKYKTANETVGIEVDEEWGSVLIDLDRQEYNNDHKETRRHTSLDAFNLDGNLFSSGGDIADEYQVRERNEKLYHAIQTLSPDQQVLVHNVFFEERSLVSIAEDEGVSHVAIHNRLKKIYAHLKKVLN